MNATQKLYAKAREYDNRHNATIPGSNPYWDQVEKVEEGERLFRQKKVTWLNKFKK